MMSNRKNGSQFSLDLSGNTEAKTIVRNSASNVTQFVDAATLNARREAVRRVASNGIFATHAKFKD